MALGDPMTTRLLPHRAIVALGGNAITRRGESDTVENDYINLERSLEDVVKLLELGYQIVLTHGNGPQIGNQMIRVELSRHEVPDLPLDIMGADIQGGLGYMIERVLRSKLRRRGLAARVCCMLTMVTVDPNDAAFQKPTKFVGPTYTTEQIERLKRERGWIVAQTAEGGWRRVVPSPDPITIVERHGIVTLLQAGFLVISGGGGGIPVTRTSSGDVVGVEAVIDKDLSAAVIGLAVDASELFILTTVEQVMLHYGTPQARPLTRATVAQARELQQQGHFPPGSMGPKIEAACRFIEGGGSRVLITHDQHLVRAIQGETGTWITAD